MRLGDVDNIQKELHNQHKSKIEQFQNDLLIREAEINRTKKMLDMRDADVELLKKQL